MHDAAQKLVGCFHPERFEGLTELAVDFLDDNLRLGDRHFIAFAAHGFDQDPKMQLAAAGHREFVRIFGRFDAQGEVWIGAVMRLERARTPWTVVTYLPEEDILGQLSQVRSIAAVLCA